MFRCIAVALSVFVLSAVHAQTAIVSSSVDTPPQATRPSLPVSIALERKTLQTLGDGTHITRTTREWFYRDSQGRTRIEAEINGNPGMADSARTSVMIFDPVAGQTLTWLTGPGQQHMYSMFATARPTPPTEPTENVPLLRRPPEVPTLIPAEPAPPRKAVRASTHREDLGTQEVQGEPCKATRTTTVYPIAMLGNDRPITVVRESCMSREIGRVLSERQDDPRTGLRTLAVTSLSRTDPDAALFGPPADYTERPQPAKPSAP